MPSTRKQKAREKRSRQSDEMYDIENMNVMLGNYQENQSDVDLNENVEIDSRSNGTRTDMVRNCEDFRTLLTSEDRNRCERPTEANRLITEEIACQMNRKMDELRRNLDTQITESINSAIPDSILPSIQNSLSGQNSGLGTNVDSRSSRLSRNTEGKKHQSAWGNTHCRVQSNSNNHPQSRDNSLSSLDCRDERDRKPPVTPLVKRFHCSLGPNAAYDIFDIKWYHSEIYFRALCSGTKRKIKKVDQNCIEQLFHN